MEFRHCNCIVIFNKNKDKLLFCKRAKDPYKGLYNFVGGKLEKGESSKDAAYRELYEETGITKQDIELHRLMDMTYYQQKFVLEIYVGMLRQDVNLVEEVNALEWMDGNENFTDSCKYAGDKNIAHIVEVAKMYDLTDTKKNYLLKTERLYVGVDGCKGGWIAAAIKDGELSVKKYSSFADLVSNYVNFDNMLVDMVIGLPSNVQQYEKRPDFAARRIIAPRTSTIFAVPARQAVYETSKEKQREANQEALGLGLSAQTIAIIPKMREVDEFLSEHPTYKNVIKESHPEVGFARLNGKVVMSNKSNQEGMIERVNVLSAYFPHLTEEFILSSAKSMGCNPDDILDAICLAVTANLDVQGKAEVIPENVSTDDRGLRMQMVIPCLLQENLS